MQVIERRRRSNTPPQVKKKATGTASDGGADPGAAAAAAAAPPALGAAAGAGPGAGRRPSMKEKVESFFIRGRSIKATSLLPPAPPDAAAADPAAPVPSLVYPAAANGDGAQRGAAAAAAGDDAGRGAGGASTSEAAATAARTGVSLGRSFSGAAINNTSERELRLSGDHCVAFDAGASDAGGGGTSYFLCRLGAGNALRAKLQTCASPSEQQQQQQPGASSSLTRTSPGRSPSGLLRSRTAAAGRSASSPTGAGGSGAASSCYIAVGRSGFRFFRPSPPTQAKSGGLGGAAGSSSSFPFAHFALDKIHSWSFQERNAFSFKFFEVAEKRLVEVRGGPHRRGSAPRWAPLPPCDRVALAMTRLTDVRRAPIQFAFTVPSMELLKAELTDTIASLVAGRQSRAVAEATFVELVDRLANSRSEEMIEVIVAALDEVYITAKQGSLLLEMIEDDFDKVRRALSPQLAANGGDWD